MRDDAIDKLVCEHARLGDRQRQLADDAEAGADVDERPRFIVKVTQTRRLANVTKLSWRMRQTIKLVVGLGMDVVSAGRQVGYQRRGAIALMELPLFVEVLEQARRDAAVTAPTDAPRQASDPEPAIEQAITIPTPADIDRVIAPPAEPAYVPAGLDRIARDPPALPPLVRLPPPPEPEHVIDPPRRERGLTFDYPLLPREYRPPPMVEFEPATQRPRPIAVAKHSKSLRRFV